MLFFKPLLAMHIPDGFVSVPVSLAGWLLMIVAVAVALQQTRGHLGERQIPLIGILAAFTFAAQMINFPVAGGTSGHLLGGALVAILIGPWAAVLVMVTVLAVQGFLFQDGGLLALGMNVTNMAVLAPFVGYTVYKSLGKLFSGAAHGELMAAGFAAWATVVLASAAAALELAISGTSPLNVALPAMVAVHAVIGLGEALITVGALAFIRQVRPDLLSSHAAPASQGSAWIAAGLVIALLIVFASPLASSFPDGLERVAEDKGFLDEAQEAAFAIMPDYTVSFIQNEAVTTIVSGVAGVLAVAIVSFLVGRGAARSKGISDQQETQRQP